MRNSSALAHSAHITAFAAFALSLVAVFIACGSEPASTAAQATSTPIPTSTPLPTYTLYPTATPAPTYTPYPTHTPPPTPTSSPRPTVSPPSRMNEVECPNCQWDTMPILDSVSWIQKPLVSASGELSFIARIDEGHDMIFPGSLGGGASNVTLVNGPVLYGMVLPPAGPGWNWTPRHGQYIADTYTLRNRTFSVVAQLDPSSITHPGLQLCIWSGGTNAEILACESVQQP